MVEIKSQLKLERFITVDPQSLERFEREGRRLGQMGQPASNATELCKVESDEINSVSIAWNNYQNEVSKNTERLKNLIDDAKNIIENVLPAKESEVSENYDAELSRLETEIGPNSAAYANNSDLLDNAMKDVSQIKKSLGNRELQINFEKSYLPFMVALAFAEVWVNSKSFELFFASKQVIALLLASAVGAMLVFFAHLTGTAIKRASPEYMQGKRGKTVLSMLLLNSLVSIFIYYLALMRQAWVSLDMDDGAPLLSLDVDGLENALNDVDSFTSLFGTEIGSEGLFLLLFNVIVYVAGTAGGFIRHDSHPDYENLVKKEAKYREKQVYFKKQFETGVAETKKNRTEKITGLRTQASEKEAQLAHYKRELDTLEKESKALKAAVTKSLNDKLLAFRRANRIERSDKAPRYFSDKVSL